jgi:hypothetical protein
MEIHKKTSMHADIITAIKFQQALNSSTLGEAEKDLIKSQPKK